MKKIEDISIHNKMWSKYCKFQLQKYIQNFWINVEPQTLELLMLLFMKGEKTSNIWISFPKKRNSKKYRMHCVPA